MKHEDKKFSKIQSIEQDEELCEGRVPDEVIEEVAQICDQLVSEGFLRRTGEYKMASNGRWYRAYEIVARVN